jgi:hypothetical protein
VQELRAQGDVFDAAATRRLLDDHFDPQLSHRFDAADLVDLLDKKTVVAYFVARPAKSEDGTKRLNLPDDVQLDIWRGWIEAAASEAGAENTIEMLHRALISLRYGESAERDASLNQLIQEVFRACAGNEPLYIWRRFADKPATRKPISRMLKDEARARAQAGRQGWELEYLLYADDEGASFLAELNLAPDKLHSLIQYFIKLFDSDEQVRVRARNWLNRLDTSPLRSQLRLDSKLALHEFSRETWRDFWQVWKLYNGETQGDRIRQLTDPARAKFLEAELGEMAGRAPEGVPRIADLREMLGGLTNVRDKLALLRPALNWKTIKPWYEGWTKLDKHDFACQEVIRLLKQPKNGTASNPAVPKSFTFADYNFKPRHVEALFADLLFAGGVDSDKDHASKLNELLTRQSESARTREAVGAVVRNSAGDDASVRVFGRRFFDTAAQRRVLDIVLGCLTKAEADRLIEGVARHYPDAVLREASYFYNRVAPAFSKKKGGAGVGAKVESLYELALARFLLSRPGSKIMKAVADDVHGWGGSELMHKNLLRILERATLPKRRDDKGSASHPDSATPSGRNSAAHNSQESDAPMEGDVSAQPLKSEEAAEGGEVIYAPASEGMFKRIWRAIAGGEPQAQPIPPPEGLATEETSAASRATDSDETLATQPRPGETPRRENDTSMPTVERAPDAD